METISQRELRNDSAEVMRRVEQGHTYTVTRRGVPVAKLSPMDEDSDLRCAQPARRRVAYSELARVSSTMFSEELMTELRDDR